MVTKYQDFKFLVPVDITKSEDGEMRIGGIAATEDRDAQGEIVKMDGLDISALRDGRGVFNDDHRKGFENIVGIIDNADLTDKGLYVEGPLLKNEKGRNIYEIMQHCKKSNKPPRVQMSIEGKIFKREGKDRKIITKAKIDKIALTLDPVNRSTYADLVKSLVSDDSFFPDAPDSGVSNTGTVVDSPSARSVPASFLEETITRVEEKLDKALSMQVGDHSDTLPKDMTGAPALTKESLDSKKKKKTDKEKVKEVIKSLAKSYPGADLQVIADVVLTKYKETHNVG